MKKLAAKNEVGASHIIRQLPKDDAYDHWLARITSMEKMTLTLSPDDDNDSLEIGFKLFPLIESISYSLFGKNGRYYLRKLGYSRQEADVIYSVFRNGHAHTGSNYRLIYDDGEVSWGMMSSGGSDGKFRPFDPGYKSVDYPQDNYEAEKPFDYFEEPDGTYHAILQLDRLAAQIRHDLINRKSTDNSQTKSIIVGQRIYGKRRRPSRKL